MRLRVKGSHLSASGKSVWVILVATYVCCLTTSAVRAQSDDSSSVPEVTAPNDSMALTADPSSALGLLVQQVADQVIARYEQPWGRVVERRRSRVYVVPQGSIPEKGAQFLVMRPVPGMNPARERLICRLKVQRVDRTMVECKEFDRTGKDHAEPDDVIRVENTSTKAILAPCISAVDLAPVISQVLGEKLRRQLQGRPTLQLLENLTLEKDIESAYWSGSMARFLAELEDVDVVLVPVLLRSEEKLILNVEYFSVRRQAATDIDVSAIPLNEMLLSWLRAGRTRDYSPPGYRSLPAQTYHWSLHAMAGLQDGGLLAVLRDSVRAFEFAYPGLRMTGRAALPSRDRTRQLPYVCLVGPPMLRAAAKLAARSQGEIPLDVSALQAPDNTLWMLSDERRPTVVDVSNGQTIQVEGRSAEVVAGLQQLWLVLDGPASLRHRWWPNPGGERKVLYPLVADIDGDALADLLWSDVAGVLQLQRHSSEHRESLSGFGDIKALQPAQDASSHAVLWLTDPVWENGPDRLTAVQHVRGRLQTVWRSKSFQNTLVAVASVDLNADGAADLVVAEALPRGTQLHLFLALPGENTAARGGPWNE